MSERLKGKRVLITGTSRAQGAAAQRLFVREGARVSGCASTPGSAEAEAAKKKILGKSVEEGKYAIPGAGKQTLEVQAMDAANTPEPPQHVKNMLGWNRKALRIPLPATEAKSPAVSATEALASLAAGKWAVKAKA